MFESSRPSHRASSAAVAFVGVAVLLLGVTGGAFAQDDVDDLRDRREVNRRDAAAVAAELDALSAEDAELVDALEAIDAHVALQEAKVAAAEEAIALADAQAADARSRAAEIADDIESVRDRLRERAVEAFIGPRNDAFSELDSADLVSATLRRSFLDQIVGDEYELVDDLRVKVSEQQGEERDAAALAAEAQSERSSLEQRLADLDEARTEADQLRAEVKARVDEWQTAGLDLAAADRSIADEIRRLEAEAARVAREAEAQRLAEEEAARIAAEETAAIDPADIETAEGDADDAEATSTAAPSPTGPFALTHRPVPGRVTSPFGDRVHPIFGTVRSHFGSDMDGDRGDPIVAAAAGTVLVSGWMNGYGNTVIISHGNGATTVYAHQNDLAVSVGQAVAGGELIGRVGSTGWSTGPHLHFEVRIQGVAVDPESYMP